MRYMPDRVKRVAMAAVVAGAFLASTASAARPSFVDITWVSVSNMYYEVGGLKKIPDGYITRIPQSAFLGGGDGLAHTRQPFQPDVAGATRVMTALGGKRS